MSYTYLIKFKPTGQLYYGVRYAKSSNPEEFFKTYFTSSKYVKKLIQLHGIEAFEYEIRMIFKNKSSAIRCEHRVLKHFNVVKNDKWLNRTDGKAIQYDIHPLTGRKLSIETKKKIGLANKGKIRTNETKVKLSKSHIGNLHWNYGKKWSNDVINKNRNTNINSYHSLSKEAKEIHKQKSLTFKSWKLIDPDGNTHIITNLAQFCRDNNLVNSNLIQRKFCKGWKLITYL